MMFLNKERLSGIPMDSFVYFPQKYGSIVRVPFLESTRLKFKFTVSQCRVYNMSIPRSRDC